MDSPSCCSGVEQHAIYLSKPDLPILLMKKARSYEDAFWISHLFFLIFSSNRETSLFSFFWIIAILSWYSSFITWAVFLSIVVIVMLYPLGLMLIIWLLSKERNVFSFWITSSKSYCPPVPVIICNRGAVFSLIYGRKISLLNSCSVTTSSLCSLDSSVRHVSILFFRLLQ